MCVDSVAVHILTFQTSLVSLVAQLPPPVFDNFGREVSSGVTDAWPARCGIALALAQLAPAYRPAQVTQLFDFYVAKGLNDRSAEVSQQMLTAALAALNHHGKVGGAPWRGGGALTWRSRDIFFASGMCFVIQYNFHTLCGNLLHALIF